MTYSEIPNSIILRHESEERSKERMANLEAQGRECEKCGHMSVEVKRICKAHGDKITAYCHETGGPGCLWKRTGNCHGSKLVETCQDCGKTQGEE